jgi:hypothetical protein
MGEEALAWRDGGCHCGAVRFQAKLPGKILAQACNCSICAKSGFVHVIVPERRFRLVQGGERLTPYVFGTGVARHLFCAHCGVKAFYRPRSNPDGWSVNANCLDDAESLDIKIEAFDGRNWEASAPALAHLSRDPA